MREQDIHIDEIIASTQKSKERKYWLNKFSGELHNAYFPRDYNYNRQGNSQYKSQQVKRSLPRDLCDNLMKAASESDARLFMVLTAGLILLLRGYTGNGDITVGTTVLKQNTVVNYFNTVLALRNHIKEDMTFKELLLQVRQTVIEATQKQNYPIKSLLYQLKLPYSETDFPLFDNVILLENIHSKSYLQGIKPGMIFSFSRQDRQVDVTVEYNSIYYKPDTVEKILTHFNHLMSQTLTDAGRQIVRCGLLTPTEEQELLIRYNDFQLDYPRHKSIHRLFAEQVEKTPDAAAVVYENSQITYKKLSDKAVQMASQLIKKGVTAGSIVGLMVERSIEMVIGILAILKAGAAYLPMDSEYPQSKNIYIAKDSQMKALLTQEFILEGKQRLQDALTCEHIGLITFEDESSHRAGNNEPGVRVQPSASAYVIYTSGTTGNPKGVIVEHRSVVNLVYGLNERVYKQYPPARNLCLVAPYVFDASVKQIFAALLLGHKLNIAPAAARMDSTRLLQLYKKHRIEISDGTPILLRMLYEVLKKGNETPDIKHFLMGGEALPRQTVSDFFGLFHNRCPGITNVYGPTECCVDATSFQLTHNNLESLPTIPIGKPMPNYRIYIINDKNQLVPAKVPGELCIGGPGLGRGYLNRVRLTNEKFTGNPFEDTGRIYHTGDLARWLPEGNIEFLGRLDRQVKIRGVRVELEEIEAELEKHKQVKNPLVLHRTDEVNDQYLCAYYLSDEEIDPLELKQFLAHCLPYYLIPTFFIRLDKIPVALNGKVDLAALPLPASNVTGQDKYEAPSDSTETTLVRIWEEVLTAEKIGVNDDFFALGGHSLKSAIMQARIEEEYSIKIPLTEIFNAPTIKQLAQYIKRSGDEGIVPDDKNLVLIKKNGAKPAKHLFFIHDGTGETDRYIDFCNQLNIDACFWGIRADRLDNYTPRNITIEDVGRQYIRTIKKVQPEGPYHIVGYCIGGTIAFEIVWQLEQLNEEIEFFSIIDSPLAENTVETGIKKFSTDTELGWIRDLLPDETTREKFENIIDMNRVWAAIADYIDENGYGAEKIRPLITGDLSEALPNYEQLSAKQLIYYVNVLRTFIMAREFYVPHGKVETEIHYFGAAQGNSSYEDSWKRYFSRINSYRVKGNHYSIFTMPQLVEFARMFEEVAH